MNNMHGTRLDGHGVEPFAQYNGALGAKFEKTNARPVQYMSNRTESLQIKDKIECCIQKSCIWSSHLLR